MKIRRIAPFFIRAIVGIGSLLLSLYALYVYSGLNLRQDPVPLSLYCLLPLLSFPVYLLGVWRLRASVVAHWASAVIYLAAYSALDWRVCSELGYCQSLLATVLETTTARPVEAMFAVATLNLIALLLRGQSSPAIQSRAAQPARYSNS
jgi:glucan phosphoethanolaminetransferase (alkaline phosphatase superfamily)